MQGWYYGKGLFYYSPININQSFAVVPALHSVLYFNLNIRFRARKVTGTFEKRAHAYYPPKSNQERIKGLFWSNYMSLVKNNFSFNSV